MTVEELLYGDIAEYRATRDLRAGEIVRVDSRFGVVQSDLRKGDFTEVICTGPFVYECSSEYAVCEGDPVYFDLKRQTFVASGTRGAKVIGTAALPCHCGDKLVVAQINGNG